jgi:hypothetical protein
MRDGAALHYAAQSECVPLKVLPVIQHAIPENFHFSANVEKFGEKCKLLNL